MLEYILPFPVMAMLGQAYIAHLAYQKHPFVAFMGQDHAYIDSTFPSPLSPLGSRRGSYFTVFSSAA